MKKRSLQGDLFATLRGVLRRRDRLARLFALGPRRLAYLVRFFTHVVPLTLDELSAIRRSAAAIPDTALREQALASIHDKAYHVQGGCILATFLDTRAARRHVVIVTALETIYDYLDNICDRLPGVPCEAYPTIHEALLDAVDLERTPSAYYRDGPHRDDGGYLRGLVDRVRDELATLKQYALIAEPLREVTRLYSELQSYKHLAPGAREARCEQWFAERDTRFAHLRWNEFAAACGSSLPVFALLALAEDAHVTAADVERTYGAYLPAVSALHILFDYYIDQQEDRDAGELNFVEAYADPDEGLRRLRMIAREAIRGVRATAHPRQHEFLVLAMGGFYLTHPKIFTQGLDFPAAGILGELFAPKQ